MRTNYRSERKLERMIEKERSGTSLRATVRKDGLREMAVAIAPSASARSTSSSQDNKRGKRSTHVLYELETGGDFSSIGLVLRAIYDGGNLDEFVRTLERSIKYVVLFNDRSAQRKSSCACRRYDRDIERMCSFHFNGFVEAVQELATLRQECDTLSVRFNAFRLSTENILIAARRCANRRAA